MTSPGEYCGNSNVGIVNVRWRTSCQCVVGVTRLFLSNFAVIPLGIGRSWDLNISLQSRGLEKGGSILELDLLYGQSSHQKMIY